MQSKGRSDYLGRSTRSERAILLDSESDEDNVNGANFSRPKGPESNISKVKADISTVTKTMQSNLSKVLDRGSKIEDLQDKSENLNVSAFKFISGSRKLQRKLWWQNIKLKLLFGFIVFGLIVILIVSFIIRGKKS